MGRAHGGERPLHCDPLDPVRGPHIRAWANVLPIGIPESRPRPFAKGPVRAGSPPAQQVQPVAVPRQGGALRSRRCDLPRPRRDHAARAGGARGDAAVPHGAVRQRLRAALGGPRRARRPRRRARARRAACSASPRTRSSSPAAARRPTTWPCSAARSGQPGRVVASAIEHPPVREPVRALGARGWEVGWAPVDARRRRSTSTPSPTLVRPGRRAGLRDVGQQRHRRRAAGRDGRRDLRRPRRAAAPRRRAGALRRPRRARLACPATVTVTLAAHKLGGPKGVGVARRPRHRSACRRPCAAAARSAGLRPGTENVAGCRRPRDGARAAPGRQRPSGPRVPRAATADRSGRPARRRRGARRGCPGTRCCSPARAATCSCTCSTSTASPSPPARPARPATRAEPRPRRDGPRRRRRARRPAGVARPRDDGRGGRRVRRRARRGAAGGRAHARRRVVIDLARAGAVERPDGEGVAGGRVRRPRSHHRRAGARAPRARPLRRRRVPGGDRGGGLAGRRAEGAALLDAARLGTDAASCRRPRAPAARRTSRWPSTPSRAALGDARRARRDGGRQRRGRAIGRHERRRRLRRGARRAAAAAGAAVGVTLRLWIDPRGARPRARLLRADGGPPCPRRLPRPRRRRTSPLDLREAFRAAVVEPFVADYAAGETPNPCVRCNGDFRLDALLDAADGLGGERAADRALRAHRRARRRAARRTRRRPAQGPELHARAARRRPRWRALGFPLGGADEGRDARAGAGARPRGRRRAREPGGLLPRRRRLPRLPARAGRAVRRRRRRWTRRAASSAATTARPASRRASAAGCGCPAPSRCTCCAPTRRRNVVVVAPRARLGRDRLRLHDARLHVERTRVDAKLRYRSPAVAATRRGTRRASSSCTSTGRPSASRPGQTAALVRRRRRRRRRHDRAPEARVTVPDRPCIVVGLQG